MHINPKSMSEGKTAGPVTRSTCLCHPPGLTHMALSLNLQPLAAADPGVCGVCVLSLNPSQPQTVKTGTLASQCSGSEGAAEVWVPRAITCHIQNTPSLPLLKAFEFFFRILHISSPPSPFTSQHISSLFGAFAILCSVYLC